MVPHPEADLERTGLGAGGSQLSEHEAGRRDHVHDAAKERNRVAADSDIAVEEDGGAPTTLGGKGIEHGSFDGGGADVAGAHHSRW